MTPASIRNRNPGAMYPGPSSKRFGSTSHEVLHSKDGEHKIATFPDNVSGAAALFDLLSSPAYTGRPISEAIKKWCGGFYVSTYIHVLEQNGGITRDTILTRELLSDAAVAIPIGKAMALQEAGRDFPMSEAEWSEAHARAFASEPAPIITEASNNSQPAPNPLHKSGTLRGIVSAAIEAVAGPVAIAIGLLTEAATKFNELQPVHGMFAQVGANAKALSLGFVAASLTYAASRRVKASQEGKAG